MLRRSLTLSLLALVVVAVGCSNAEEGGLETRGDAQETTPSEAVRPSPAAGVTGGGVGSAGAVNEAAAAGVGQVGAVFPETAQPTGRAPERTHGFLRDTSHLDPDTAEYRREHGASGHG